MADLFAPDSMIRRVGAEPAALLGAGRALLLQVAHPSVAQGVADHSEFQANPFKRLSGTLEATYAVVFGTTELADSVGRRVSSIHDHVTGPGYEANDPNLLMWVHATLLDTALGCYERYVRPLRPDERRAFYEESKQVAEVFGCPVSAQPDTFADFQAYFDETVAALKVSDEGRRLAHDIIWPALPIVPGPLRVALRPPLSVFRLLSVGTLPERLRDQLGFQWSAEKDKRYRAAERVATLGFDVVPPSMRTLPTRLQNRYLLSRARRRLAPAGEGSRVSAYGGP